MANKKKRKGWALCLKNGWKVFKIYPTKEEAEKRLSNPNLYEVRRIIE